MNGIFKDDLAVALDDVTARSGELIELFESLERGGHATHVLEHLAGPRHAFSRALDALLEARRAAGDLPAIGNVERAQFGAVGMSLEAFITSRPDDDVVTSHLETMTAELINGTHHAAQLLRGEVLSRRVQDLEDAVRSLRAALDDVPVGPT
jgi:hypothetical protein